MLGAAVEGERVRLRPVIEADLAALVAFLNDPDINRWIALPSGPPPSLEAEHRWFASVAEDPAQFVWSVERRSDRALLGTVVLHHTAVHPEAAELGICLGNKALWGEGLGTDAVRTVVRAAFVTLGLHRVWLRADEANGRALRTFAKAGFRTEGRVRDYRRRWSDGAFVTGVVMGILATDANT